MKCLICDAEISPNGASFKCHLSKVHSLTIKDYYDKYLKKPDEGICPVCKQQTKFNSIRKGYGKYCSVECKRKVWYDTYKETCLKKYNCENAFQSEQIKYKIRRKNVEKYGEEFPNRFSGNRFNETMTKKYGNGWIKDISKKGQDAFKEKYGVTNPSNVKDFVLKSKITKFLQNFANDLDDAANIKFDPTSFEVSGVCNICNQTYTIDAGIYRTRFKNNLIICDKCNPVLEHDKRLLYREQDEVFDFIKSITDTELIKNDRKILDGKELDIFIPEKKLAIEFDGLYWHDELHKSKTYHLWKTEECEKQGIQLIHIFEDEWLLNRNIVCSRLKSLLNLNDVIFARKTTCDIISFKDCKNFLNLNHIQGTCSSKYNYGLFHNGELVSVMTFGKSRFKDGEFELLRFANKLYTNVVGGASKLFSHFRKDHPEVKKIISYADRRWSKGNLYENLGFTCTDKTPISYCYVLKDRRHNRIEFQKHKLVAEGADPNKSEHEIMLDKGIYRIYDCGNLKYEYTNEDRIRKTSES